MKKGCLLIATLAIFSQSFAADTLSSKIKQATVFLSGAQVFRETKAISIRKGVNEVIIKDVSPYLNPHNIQATAKGRFLILDVQHKVEYIMPPEQKPQIIPEKVQKEINRLNDSLLFIGFEREEVTAKLQTLNEEKNMIIQNKLIKNGGVSDTLPELKNVVSFYREKLGEINEMTHKLKKQQHFIITRETKHRTRLNELNNFNRKTAQPTPTRRERHHILVTTYSEVATTGSIKVNYLIPNAGWVPAYDLRAKDLLEPMAVTYKAHVYQNSGEEWKNVKLVLSTYNQNCFTTKPTIGVWRLDYKILKYQNGQVQSRQFSQNFASKADMSNFKNSGYESIALSKDEELKIVDNTFTPLQELAQINQDFTNVEFEIKLPYSVKADGQKKLMVVTHKKVPALFSHYILPRVNKNGFLLAKIGDWESLNLLPGQANIYFKNTYVGQTQINPTTMQDTMELALGRDQGIVSTRKKIKEEEKKTALGKKRRRTFTFEIVVRNNTKAAIELNLEDQIPITSNEEIEIKLLEDSNAELAEKTGRLTWKLKLKAGEKRTVIFSYSVEHDKDKELA